MVSDCQLENDLDSICNFYDNFSLVGSSNDEMVRKDRLNFFHTLTYLKRGINTKIQAEDLPAGIAKRRVARSARAKLNKSVGDEVKINAK